MFPDPILNVHSSNTKAALDLFFFYSNALNQIHKSKICVVRAIDSFIESWATLWECFHFLLLFCMLSNSLMWPFRWPSLVWVLSIAILVKLFGNWISPVYQDSDLSIKHGWFVEQLWHRFITHFKDFPLDVYNYNRIWYFPFEIGHRIEPKRFHSAHQRQHAFALRSLLFLFGVNMIHFVFWLEKASGWVFFVVVGNEMKPFCLFHVIDWKWKSTDKSEPSIWK